ncbi:uncharacterized protein LOC143837738 [Paroedura picta]|uniref:uncharacterized protein LOC143835630 n=1 Tax=Paroedura picta TaxID=143630 RepID=UPI00405733BF
MGNNGIFDSRWAANPRLFEVNGPAWLGGVCVSLQVQYGSAVGVDGRAMPRASQGLSWNVLGTGSGCLGPHKSGSQRGCLMLVTENGTMRQMEWHAIRPGSDPLGGLKASPGSDIVWMQLPSWTLLRRQTSCSSVTVGVRIPQSIG